MSTLESNLKAQPATVLASSSSSQPATPLLPPSSLPIGLPLTPTTSLPASPSPFYDDKPVEKLYKKEKQIQFEFEQIVRDIRFQLNEQLKCLEQRIETQLLILAEIQEYFRRRADVELDYAKNLDNLHKQVGQKHRTQKGRRETWIFQSIYKLWDTIVQDTRTHVKYHTIISDVCGKYMFDKFNEITDDTRRMFMKCKSVGLASHDDIYKVLNELQSTMKTYHQYQSESKQAEQKLSVIQQQMAKIKSVKKQKSMEKRVEKRQRKYTETKVKAFKARNDYLMTIESVNTALQKYCSSDVPDLIDCMNFGFHTSVSKCIQMYLSAQENIKRGRQATIDTLNRAIGDLDTVTDKQKYLEYYGSTFTIPKRIRFEPHKGDEVSAVNAQVLIRDEMQSRFVQMQSRVASLKTENDEIFKTIEATEKSLMEFINTKNSDVSDLFKDLNLPQNTSKNQRIEIEDYYVEKFKQYTLSSNIISRLQARHDIMQKALGASPAAGSAEDKNLLRRPAKPKQIGRAPILGRPRLFGGKLSDYIEVTQQHIPQIISSCVSAINRLGLHNQGIFRVPGAQVDINQFKDAFERAEDPLVNVTGRDMNSVAGVLKLYFRELKEPLVSREMFDLFISCTVDVESESKCVENLCQVVKLLPRPIFIVMRYFFAFLNHLAEYSDENMMDASNLASCLAPSLMPIPEDKDQVQYLTHTIELLRTMISHHEEIFPSGGDGPVYEKFAIMIPIDGEEDEDDEGISERSLKRSASDDEMDAMEAVALFDYTGRNNEELSFKKNELLSISKKLTPEWWLGQAVDGHQSGFIPDGYITFQRRSRDSTSFRQHLLTLRAAADPSFSHRSINATPPSQDRSTVRISTPIVHYRSPKTSLVDSISDDDKSSTPSDNQTSARPSLSTYRTTFDVPPSPMSSSSSASSFSQLISINEKQIIDIDSALRDVLSGIRTVEECHAQCFRSASISSKQQQQQQPETDAPDLVLNLPVSNGLVTPPASKSLDDDCTYASSSTADALARSASQRNRPPPILKKSDKTRELITRLGLPHASESSCGATSSLSTNPSLHFNVTYPAQQQQQQQRSIPILGSSKTTDV